jgi:hypothetical protein
MRLADFWSAPKSLSIDFVRAAIIFFAMTNSVRTEFESWHKIGAPPQLAAVAH